MLKQPPLKIASERGRPLRGVSHVEQQGNAVRLKDLARCHQRDRIPQLVEHTEEESGNRQEQPNPDSFILYDILIDISEQRLHSFRVFFQASKGLIAIATEECSNLSCHMVMIDSQRF